MLTSITCTSSAITFTIGISISIRLGIVFTTFSCKLELAVSLRVSQGE